MLIISFMLIFLLILSGSTLFAAFSIGASAYLMYGSGFPLPTIGQMLFSAIDKYVFLAIPLFIFAGSLMVRGGCSQSLIRMVHVFLGKYRGSLGLTVIGSSAVFSAMTGANVACAAAIGSMLIPEMEKKGYSRGYAAALTASSSSLGNLIPPSLTAIVYCGFIETSVAQQFLGGVFPGLLMMVLLSVVSIIISRKRGYGGGTSFTWQERGRATVEAIPALFMPVLILGGIYSGIFTATEAAAVSCLYAMIIGFFVYRKLSVNTFRNAMLDAGRTTANIYLLIASVTLIAKMLTLSGTPQSLAAWVAHMELGPLSFMLVTCVILFLMGTVIDANPLILLSIPIFMPSINSLGISPILFGVILALAVGVGLITPPVAVTLYVVTGISKANIAEVIKDVIPYLGVQIFTTILVIIFPGLATWLPGLIGG